MTSVKTAIGLMSGTSMDGIDAALVRTDGSQLIEILDHLSIAYSAQFRDHLKAGLKDAEKIVSRADRPGRLREIENALTDKHGEAVRLLLQKAGLKATDIDVIGFHGQTVLHKPEKALTVQLGDGDRLAQETTINVIYDMRANDMRNGGQGAPLVPVYHRALALQNADQLSFPVAFVNIGGISNLTYINDETLIAFDCGPGNALIDQWMKHKTNADFDRNGECGLKGNIIEAIASSFKEHPFLNQSHPGSLDWRDFSPLIADIATQDGAATLSYLTAYSIIHSLRFVPQTPKTIVVSGGGVKNQAIMRYLNVLSQKCGTQAITTDDIGLDSSFIEAQAWAYLAVRSLHGLPLTYPSTTGCKKASTGGVLAFANERSK